MAVILASAACGSDDTATGPDPAEPPFLAGTQDDPQIGLVVASLGRTLTMFQLGDPEERRTIALGASTSVTPVGMAVRGNRILVPLGNAASVALIDATTERVERFFLFASGNTSGSAWIDDRAALVSNLVSDQVGRITTDQSGDAIDQLVDVAPAPADILLAAGRAFVVSGNLGDDFLPLGNGIVTALDPTTLEVLGTIDTGGSNPQYGAVGPDGRLYVVNTGDFFTPGTMAVIDPVSLERTDLIEGMGVGPGAISIDDRGLAYVSGFFFGTIVFDTTRRSFVRGPDDPVCAPLEGGGCRGAFHARADRDGDLYQVFFGSPNEGLAPFTFVFDAETFALADSVPADGGPAAVAIQVFPQ
jgi:DNA-binding beta-propeller fold protein YncE